MAKKEVAELGKIFENLKKDAWPIMADLALGIRSFGVIGIIGVVLGIWAIGGGVLELLIPPTSSVLVLFYFVLGITLVISSAYIVRRFRFLKNKYSWVFKAEKSLKK